MIKKRSKIKMCSTFPFPLIICFKGLQLPRLSDYCQHPLKAALEKGIGFLICLQIQFPSALLIQQSTDIFWNLSSHRASCPQQSARCPCCAFGVQPFPPRREITFKCHLADHIINSDLSIILCGCCFALGIIITIPHLSYSTHTTSPRKLL